MRANGASEAAVSFAASQNGKLFASGFTQAHVVDVIAVSCTGPSNFNCGYSYLIVNGQPSPVEADWLQSDDLNNSPRQQSPV